MTLLLRDPTAEIASTLRPRHPPLETFVGKCVALLDIGKMRGDEFIDWLENRMNGRGIVTRRYKKPTFTKPAPEELRRQIAQERDFVIEALAA